MGKLTFSWFNLEMSFSFHTREGMPGEVLWKWTKKDKLLLLVVSLGYPRNKFIWSWGVTGVEELKEDILMLGFSGGLLYKPDMDRLLGDSTVLLEKLSQSFQTAAMKNDPTKQ